MIHGCLVTSESNFVAFNFDYSSGYLNEDPVTGAAGFIGSELSLSFLKEARPL